MVLNGPKWFKTLQTGPKFSNIIRIVQMFLNSLIWSNIVLNNPKLSKMVLNGSTGLKVYIFLNGPEWSKIGKIVKKLTKESI